ncbi:MAG: universal stress protein [Armatimonadetes bacterium]|nr:universal stress protein [Armatimonadota bacterium]
MIIEARGDVVKLEGALEKNYWPVIQAAANLLLRQHPQGILLDGSALKAVTPEGAKTFGEAMDYIERYKARIVVCSLPENVMEAVRAVPGVRSRLPVAGSLEEGRASLALARSGAARPAGRRRILHNVLVPLLRADSPEIAATLACRLAKPEGQDANLHLAYILEVPRHLPLNAPLPEEEATAGGVLDAAEKWVRGQGLTPVPHVRRARDAGEEIVHQAEELGVNIIVLAYAPTTDPDDPMPRILRTLLSRAPCEVVLNKVPA